MTIAQRLSAQWDARGLHCTDHSEWAETKAKGVRAQGGGDPTVVPGLYFMTERFGREGLHLAIMACWTFIAAPNRCKCFIFWYLSNENPELEGKNGVSHIKIFLIFALRFSTSKHFFFKPLQQWFPTGVPLYPGVPRTLPRGTARCRNNKCFIVEIFWGE